MIKAVIFDMDGVLVDTEPFHVEIEKRQFALNNVPVTPEEQQQYMGVAAEVMWRTLAERYSIDRSVVELIEQNRTGSIRFFSEVDEIPLMPGLIELLDVLRANHYPLAVASSSFPEIIELVLDRTGIRKYFQVVVSSQEAGKSKPEPDVFLLAAKRLGVEPRNCLVVEDSANGIKAAHSANMVCVAYQGAGADPQTQKGADSIVSDFSQLVAMVLSQDFPS
jgi:beta-phosphoglucomutase